MIKHLKVRDWISCLILGIFILSIFCAIFDSPTHSVENESVYEQVCSQPAALEIEENSVNVTGAGSMKVNPSKRKLVGATALLYPDLSEMSTVEETTGETQTVTINFEKEGWTSTNVNVREYPSTDSEILELYVYNTKINYSEYDDEWVVIEYGNSYAFMAKDYISDVELPNLPIVKEYVYKGQKLTRSLGTISGPSGKETYYNLPMGLVITYMKNLGYNYSYWIRDDGCKMYGEYIMLATDTNIRPKGTILKTSLGLGMVCDHCEAAKSCPGQIDIAVTWN